MRLIPGLTSLDVPLATFLAANSHAFTRAEILNTWSNWALERAISSGAAVVRGESLNLWRPNGLVTGPLALHLYAPELPVPRIAHLHVPRHHRPRKPHWVRICEGEVLHRSGFPDGVQCTTPARALLDAWRFSPAAERENLLWEALWERVCTWRELARESKKLSRVAGRRDLDRILGWFAEGARSPLEVRAKYETFADARFREFAWQVDLRLASRDVTVDMLHRAAGVVVELDGDKYHSTRDKRDDDRERQTLLTAAGYAVVRFGWHDVVDKPDWCREQLRATLASRAVRPAATFRMV